MARSRSRNPRTRNRERRRSTAKRVVKETNQFSSAFLKVPDGIEPFRPDKDGDYTVTILPYYLPDNHRYFQEDGDIHWEVRYKVHKGIGPKKDWVLCNLETYGDEESSAIYDPDLAECGVHNALMKLERMDWGDESAAEAVEDQLDRMADKDRQLFLLVDHADVKLKYWEISPFAFGEKLNEEIEGAAKGDEDSDVYYFYEPGRDGLDLEIRIKIDSHEGNKFPKATRVDFLERGKRHPVTDEQWDHGHCLNDWLVHADVDKYYKMTMAMFVDPEEGEQDEDDPPRHRRRRDEEEDDQPRRRRRRREDDEEPEEDPEGNEEPEEGSEEPEYDVDDSVQFETDDGETKVGKIIEVDMDEGIYLIKSGRKKYEIEFDNDSVGDPPKEKTRRRRTSTAKKSDSETEEKEPKSQAGRRQTTRSRSRKKSEDEEECPAEGGEFGVSTDQLDECDDCPLWKACDEKLQENS